MKKISFIANIVFSLSLVSHSYASEEWWNGSFIKEGTGNCEDNDSIRVYKKNKLQGWEYSCNLTTKKFNDLDAVIFDMKCSGNDYDGTIKTRELLTKTKSGFEIFPGKIKYTSCDVSKIKQECPLSKSLLKSDTRKDDKYQILQFSEDTGIGKATLTGYEFGRALWATDVDANCSNGASICKLTFKLQNGGEHSEAFENLSVNTEPWIVFAALRQNVYNNGISEQSLLKSHIGLSVNFLNRYSPSDNEYIIPENVYKFSECIVKN